MGSALRWERPTTPTRLGRLPVVAARSTGMAGLRGDRRRANAVHRFPKPRSPLHHTRNGIGASPALRSGYHFRQPDLRHDLSGISPVRLFSAIGSNITEVDFFVPGSPNLQATTTGFGAYSRMLISRVPRRRESVAPAH